MALSQDSLLPSDVFPFAVPSPPAEPSTHTRPSFLELSRISTSLPFAEDPQLQPEKEASPHLRHRVLGTPLTSAVRDVFTEESLLLSLVQQGRVFEQQEGGDQVPSQGREKIKSRGGRHLSHRVGSLPPPGPLNSAETVATAAAAAVAARGLLAPSRCRWCSALVGAGSLRRRIRPRQPSNKGAPARKRAPLLGKSLRRSRSERLSLSIVIGLSALQKEGKAWKPAGTSAVTPTGKAIQGSPSGRPDIIRKSKSEREDTRAHL